MAQFQRLAVGAAATVMFAAAGVAGAQAQDGAGERVLQSFSQCRTITAPDQRLACFDKAAASLAQAVEAKEVRILDKEDVRRTRRSLFGFTLPRVGLFDEDEEEAKKEEFTEINTTVASARSLQNGRAEIRLNGDDGAVWQTTEAMTFPPKAGDKIRIRRGAIGSYFINVGGRSVRGMRVR
ncbi:hypothetical protein SAMN05428950_102346 [Sphingomonas sp. OV641]|uniref:hypothetical protein n=1 Tax=Sphingomonas sp. OV641 TaxID=1881068 RepID=UPI0008D65842|nr:hypothetical protein [Sphingomonas sp. OV641]SEJ63829.1 hypothetical protein SAMN05428950_102346 [Sphingomonas sp. OV641]